MVEGKRRWEMEVSEGGRRRGKAGDGGEGRREKACATAGAGQGRRWGARRCAPRALAIVHSACVQSSAASRYALCVSRQAARLDQHAMTQSIACPMIRSLKWPSESEYALSADW